MVSVLKHQLHFEFLSGHHIPDGLGQFGGQRLFGHDHDAFLFLPVIPGLDFRIEARGKGRRFNKSPRQIFITVLRVVAALLFSFEVRSLFTARQ